MKIKEVQDSVTDWDGNEPGDPDSLADAVRNERKIKVFNADDNDFDKFLTKAKAKYQSLRETEQQSQSMTKPIPAEFITFGAELFNKLKDKVLDITETEQSANPQPDVIMLQSSGTNTIMVQSNKFEHAEPRRIEHVYNDMFMNASHIKETIATLVDDARAPIGGVSAPADRLADMDSDGKIIKGRVESTDTSNDSMFFITKNSEDDSETDIELSIHTKISETKQSIYNLFKLLQVEEEAVNLLENKIVKLQTALPQKHSVKLCEKVARQGSEEVVKRDNKSAGDNLETSKLICNKHSEDESKTNIAKARDHDVTAFKRKDLLHRIEVLKTLPFGDESFSEGSLNECSPLKRTVFGETAYMRKTKDYVITRSKQNNELMVESVMADKNISMNLQNTQTQAKLLTRSQMILESALYSNSGLNLDFDKLTSATSTVASNSKSQSLRNLDSFSGNSSQFDDTYSKSGYCDTYVPVKQSSEVLIFDYLNPLNNILLRPINFPMKTGVNLCDHEQNHCIDEHCNQVSKNDTTRSRTRDLEVRTVTIKQHRFEPKTARAACQRLRFSTPYSVDSERLNAETDNITKLSKDPLRNKFSSNSKAYRTNAKKRICILSTDNDKYHRSVKVTPQPKTKSQKILKSPKGPFKGPEGVSLLYESLNSLSQKKSTKQNDHSSKTRAKKLPKLKARVNNSFVQKLIADYIGFYENNNDQDHKLQDDINLNVDPNTQNFLTLSQSALSFSSSKNLNPMKGVISTSKQSTMQGMPSEPPPSKVIVFDYLNSLNNVLLGVTPMDAMEAHKYKPMKTKKTSCGFENSHSIGIHNKPESRKEFAKDFDVRTVTIKQHRVVPQPTSTQQDQRSRFSKPHTVNTEEQARKVDRIKNKPDFSLQNHYSSHSHAKITKGKKLLRSPSSGKDKHLSYIDVNPKPIAKMQSIARCPKVKIKMPVEPSSHIHESAHNMMLKKDDTKNSDRNAHRSKTRGKRNKIAKKFVSDYTGDFNLKPHYEKHSLDEVHSDLNLKSESLTAISQSGVTFTFSKNLNSTKDFLTTPNTDRRSHHHFTMQVTPSQVDTPPELICTTSSVKHDSDLSDNVVAKIDMLPFMGYQECKWEMSPADTWSFRLLNGSLRLTVRLAHRLHNATRTRVRGDTPVLDISVATVQFDRVDLVERLCARFTCASLRHIVLRAFRKKFYANDIPALLQRCATVVRVAMRWKRAMYDAKARLAYSLDTRGNLSLKVANIPIRSVWEVKIHIEQVSADDSSVPCPHACCVRVLPIVSDVIVPASEVRSALAHTPKDWGHVPSTIWRVYRLLKHKKRDDDFLLS